MIVGTVGMPGSGKDEVSAVAESIGIPTVSLGDVVREACRERGRDPETDHGEVASALREERGPAAIAERSLPAVETALDDATVVVVDGLRSPAEVACYRDAFGEDFVVLAVETSFETRADRLAGRGRDASDSDREALREREARELGYGMGEVIDDADVTIENEDRSLDSFHDAVRSVLDELRRGERP